MRLILVILIILGLVVIFKGDKEFAKELGQNVSAVKSAFDEGLAEGKVEDNVVE